VTLCLTGEGGSPDLVPNQPPGSSHKFVQNGSGKGRRLLQRKCETRSIEGVSTQSSDRGLRNLPIVSLMVLTGFSFESCELFAGEMAANFGFLQHVPPDSGIFNLRLTRVFAIKL
jgi:hypothetical protein